jgi:AraC-like DNA-binding protein
LSLASKDLSAFVPFLYPHRDRDSRQRERAAPIAAGVCGPRRNDFFLGLDRLVIQYCLDIFDRHLSQPLVTYNPDLLEVVAPRLEAELTQQSVDKSISERVKGTLRELIAGRRPQLEDIAPELRLSSRTLERHLLAEQITFHGLTEEARRKLAQHYLAQPSLQLNETAFLL